MTIPTIVLLFIKSLRLPVLFMSLLLTMGSCSAPALFNPDNYGRNHQVYAVDFNPKDLGKISISKMDEGNWVKVEELKNSPNARFNVEISGNYLTVTANKKVMDVPTYQTWLEHAMQELGYDEDDEYNLFETIEEGWIYEIDLEKHPLIETEDHRLLMYEQK